MTNENISSVAIGILQGLNEALAYVEGHSPQGVKVNLQIISQFPQEIQSSKSNN